MKKRKGIIIISIVCIGILLGIYAYIQANTISTKQTEFTVEYGDSFVLDSELIFETPNHSFIKFEPIDLSSIPLVKDSDYFELGTYELELRYKEFYQNKTQTLKINVVDTTPPVFEASVDSITILEGKDDHDYHSYFEVYDLSSVETILNVSQVDTDTPGEYEANIIAKDESGNEARHDFKVIIEAKPVVVVPPVGKPQTHSNEATYVRGIVIVNKKHPLPASYAPGENPEAKAQLLKLITEMQAQGYDIGNSYSGYRSYYTQETLYNRYVNMDGKVKAETYSARPGYSEHQTGLTFDVKHRNESLVEKKEEAYWTAEHAHEYGFIVRYPQNKESITGYQYEPWHLRYVGTQNAKEIYQSNMTLEEYLGIEGGNYYD